jgi:hypothetical protein
MKRHTVIRISRCFLFFAALGALQGIATYAFGASDPAPCSTNPEVRQLDYWLGDWTVAGPGSSSSSTSKVYLSLDKCLFVESWSSSRGHAGENMFAYSADDKQWHGMFVDNQGRVHVFVEGKVSPGVAEFTGPSRGPKGEKVLNKVRVIRVSPNKVEQTWEKSTDKGASWTTVFHGEYSRRNP